jgi:hypothetical protein
MDVDPNGATWRKSSYSNGTGGNCVEVAGLPGGRAVRDSKHPDGPILVFTKRGWQAFVQGIRAGELCAELEPGQAAGICRESLLPCLHGMITAAKRRGRAMRAFEKRWSTAARA